MKILLVDDHAILRAGLRRILEEDLHAEIGEAGSAEEALVLLAKEAWQVVILDISLPGKSGLEILPQVVASWPEAKVIVLSSFDDQQFAVRAFRDGASAFLTKEQAARELIRAVGVVMEGRRFITEEIAEILVSRMNPGREKVLHETLSSREFEVFRLIAEAKGPKDIARQLDISTKTVGTYRVRILEKMGMSTNAELMQYAIRHSLIR